MAFRKLNLSSKLFRFLVLAIVTTVITMFLTFFMGAVYVGTDVKYPPPVAGDSDPVRKVRLSTDFRSVDAKEGTLTAEWYPMPFDCSSPEAIINFYFDPNILVTSGDGNKEDIASDAVETKPTFQINTTTQCNPTLLRHSWATFRTVSKLVAFSGGDAEVRLTTNLQFYPFDKYYAPIFVFALVNSTNENVGIVNEPFGRPLNFKVELNEAESSNDSEGLYLALDVTRSNPVKFLGLIITIANWLVTITFLFITAACVVWSEEVVKEVFVIPIATLFAFTSVRAILPGAPEGFGALIDYFGILPNLVIMTLCSAVLLLVVLVERIAKERKPAAVKAEEEALPASQSGSPDPKHEALE